MFMTLSDSTALRCLRVVKQPSPWAHQACRRRAAPGARTGVPRVGVESSGSERHLGFAARGTLTLSGRCKRLRRSYSRSGDV